MKIEVLLATMNQKDYSIINKMNIKTDAIVGNQCDVNKIEEIEVNGNKVLWLSFAERGVGLNRNNALMRSKADVCILADDDLIYVDNYKNVVENAFTKYKDADVIIFNIYENPVTRYVIKNSFRVKWYNFMRFGAARIAFKRKSITHNNIFFNLHFGGGCEYGSGEDTIFLHNCLKAGLKIIAVPDYIATLKNDRASTWFNGYNDKYFYDKGALFACMYGRKAWILCFVFLLKHGKRMQLSLMQFINKFKVMLQAIKKFRANN